MLLKRLLMVIWGKMRRWVHFMKKKLNWLCHVATLHWFGTVLLFVLNFRENTATVGISQNGVVIVDLNGSVV